MKNTFSLIFLFFILSLSNTLFSQDKTVLTIDDDKVSLEEFEYIFKKNNKDKPITIDSLDNYSDLFINFKLKVKEAKAAGLDTNSSFISELNGYRRQLARPYLTDSELLDEMIQEAYSRMSAEVSASHILVKCDKNANPADSLRAYNKIMRLREKIVGGEDFEAVAKSKGGSEDPSVQQNGGYLGYFSAFQMVYPFETAAFTTEPGTISMPVRTKYGYHLVKVLDKRNAQGEIKVAHIMIQSKDEKKMNEYEQKAKDICLELKNGADFGEAALKYSDDTSSKKNGGELPWFGTGKMIPEFETAAFALKNNGDISEPVKTKNGYYIIKRIDFKPVATFDEVQKELKTKISRDQRSEATKKSFVQKMKLAYNFNQNEEIIANLRSMVDTAFYLGRFSPINEAALTNLLDQEICNINGKSIPASEFVDKVSKLKLKYRKDNPKEIFDGEVVKFMDQAILDYEDTQLEQKYPEFRLLMNEYRDGMLLFELTDKEVWTKAVKDTTGLENFYNANKTDYMWDERIKGTVYTCASKKMAKKARKMIKKGKSDVEIESVLNQESSLNFESEQGTFTKKKQEFLSLIKWKEGVSKVTEFNGQYVFLDVDEILPETQKEFSETRGPVTADYQKHLEKEWIEMLRKKYDFKLNKEVLYTLAD